MFHAIEKYKLPAQILLGLIGLSFVFVGGFSVMTPGTDYIAKVGNIKISSADVNDVLRRVQSNGGRMDKDQVFQALVDQAYLQQGAKDLGVTVSLDQIKKLIAENPGFQDKGHFSQEKFNQFLQNSGLSEDDLIAEFRKQIALQTISNITQNGALVSDQQAQQMMTMLQSPRQIQSITFDTDHFTDQVTVDDAQLKKFYEAHKKDYFLKQAVRFDYLSLSPEDLIGKETASEAELQQAYAQLPVAASTPKPSFEDIRPQLIQQVKQTKAIQALAKAKQTLTDISFDHPKSLQPAADKLGLKILNSGENWLTHDDAQMQKMPQNMQDTLFGENAAQHYNSEPIEVGENHYLVVRVTDIRKEHQASFDEVKAQVQKDFVSQESKKLAIKAAEQALQSLSKNQPINQSWSETSDITPEQAIMFMPEEDFKTWVRAKPADNKPAYVLLKSAHNPVLVKINMISAPVNMDASLPQMKMALAQTESQELINSTISWLKLHVKFKQGAQKLNNEDY